MASNKGRKSAVLEQKSQKIKTRVAVKFFARTKSPSRQDILLIWRLPLRVFVVLCESNILLPQTARAKPLIGPNFD
jgi:hypothetical protein